MPRRYYLSTLIGSGTYQDPVRAAIADQIQQIRAADPDVRASYAAAIPSLPAAGSTVLVILNTPDHTPFLADARNDGLPEFPLDGKVSAIHAPTKGAMVAAMRRRGIPTDDVDRADGYREVIRMLGRRGKPEFDENAFDAPDPT